MKLAVQLFARARELAGQDQVDLELDEGACVADVRQALAVQIPQLLPLTQRLLFAVGTRYADDHVTLGPDDSIACFPPVSGG